MDLKGWKRRIAAAGLAALTLGAPVLSPSPIAPFAARAEAAEADIFPG